MNEPPKLLNGLKHAYFFFFSNFSECNPSTEYKNSRLIEYAVDSTHLTNLIVRYCKHAIDLPASTDFRRT